MRRRGLVLVLRKSTPWQLMTRSAHTGSMQWAQGTPAPLQTRTDRFQSSKPPLTAVVQHRRRRAPPLLCTACASSRTPVRPSSSDRAPLASATNSLNWSTGSASAGTTPLKGFRTRARPLQNDFCERLAGMSIGSTTAPSFAILQDEETAASTPSSLRSESPRSRDKASDTAESTTTSVESATIPANGPLPDSPKTR